MPTKKNIHHLSIFLIKNTYSSIKQILDLSLCEEPIDIPISGHGTGQLYIKHTPAIPPKWTTLFKGHVDLNTLKIPSVSAAFALEVGNRWFILTFGQSGRFLIKEDVCEERFGLLCALNSVDPKTFRCVDVQSLDAIQSHTRIQSGQEATPDQFGLDVEQDMLKAIVGTPLNASLGNRMTGSDALSVTVRMDLSDLPFLLNEYRQQFEKDLNASDHQWVNNISLTKSSALINELEGVLNAKLGERNFENMWLSIPEIIDWTHVTGFTFSNGHKEVHPDINFQGFLKTVKPETKISLELLRTRKVHCADADHKLTFRNWPVAKCLYAEIDWNTNKYILNDGKWFSVATDFVSQTHENFSKIPASSISLPAYAGGGEGKYNASVVEREPHNYALLDDKKKVMHGGGHGQVEICDLLSINRELIHVKMYGKSSVFSHLFAQGFVSGQLIQIDPEFRKKVKAQLHEPFIDLIDAEKKPIQDEFTVIYAVISEEQGDKFRLPFFSKVNLNNTSKILKGFGYKVELLKIPFDEIYAKTTKIPPSKTKH